MPDETSATQLYRHSTFHLVNYYSGIQPHIFAIFNLSANGTLKLEANALACPIIWMNAKQYTHSFNKNKN